ncbi:hypothetical protein CsSME_00020039 [Camellia sinensis var. sinensis]
METIIYSCNVFRPIFIFTKFNCTAAAHHHHQSTATIEEEDQQRAKTQFSIDTNPRKLDSQLLCLCALIQYFSLFLCLCALIQPHHRCTAVQSTGPPGFSPFLPLSIEYEHFADFFQRSNSSSKIGSLEAISYDQAFLILTFTVYRQGFRLAVCP